MIGSLLRYPLPTVSDAGVCNIPPEKKTLGNMSFQSARFLPLDCRAMANTVGVCCSRTPALGLVCSIPDLTGGQMCLLGAAPCLLTDTGRDHPEPRTRGSGVRRSTGSSAASERAATLTDGDGSDVRKPRLVLPLSVSDAICDKQHQPRCVRTMGAPGQHDITNKHI